MPWPDPQHQLEFPNGAILLARGRALRAARRRRLRRRHLGPAGRGSARGRAAQVIAHAIGPIWEANHVWLIFVIVLVFTVFPPVFAALSIALYIPLSLALLGIVFRGAAFVFRTPARNVATGSRVWDRVFAIASTVTPVFFGMCAGAVASGQIRLVSGIPVSDPWRTWLAPFPLVIGLLALATCAYLAAVYLTLETTGELAGGFPPTRARRGCGLRRPGGARADPGPQRRPLDLARSDQPRGGGRGAAGHRVSRSSPGGRSSRVAIAWPGWPPPPRSRCCWRAGRWLSIPIWSCRT